MARTRTCATAAHSGAQEEERRTPVIPLGTVLLPIDEQRHLLPGRVARLDSTSIAPPASKEKPEPHCADGGENQPGNDEDQY